MLGLRKFCQPIKLSGLSVTTRNFGLIGSAVLTFGGDKQTRIFNLELFHNSEHLSLNFA